MHNDTTSSIRLVGCIFLAAVSAFIIISFPARAAAIAALNISSLNYTFSVNGTLRETGTMAESSSPYFWVNSGGALILSNGRGMTYQGTVSILDPWRTLYAKNNPVDTDNGTHPQNLFRLVSRSQWDNVRLEGSFKVNASHYSASPNRNASNGLLLMSRYAMGGETLYYVGVRVDGDAVIKKKKNGAYTTLAQKEVFSGTYQSGGKDNLIPHGSWVSLRAETVTNNDGSVSIRLFLRKPGESGFTNVLEAKDASSPITGSGYMGIRTDFMDVEFDDVKATKI